jgi:predicted nucleic acid-binding protein
VATKGVLIDTGPLVAILNARDQHHGVCVKAAAMLRGPFYTCWPVITEAAYLLRTQPLALEKLLERLGTSRIQILELTAQHIDAISRILRKYHDQGIDLADAAVMHLAEREKIEAVFTVDHRHFAAYRTEAGAPLALVAMKP